MSRTLRTLFAIAALCALAVLTGCASTRVIESDVQSFTAATAAVRPASYRFERLPSQQQSPRQEQLETMATQALAQVGLTPATDGRPRYAVEVGAQVLVLQNAFSYGGSVGFWGHHTGFGMGGWMEPVWYRHGVHLLLRELATGLVVYETSATYDSTAIDSLTLLPVLMQAALQDYPKPPLGPRKVSIPLSPEAPQH